MHSLQGLQLHVRRIAGPVSSTARAPITIQVPVHRHLICRAAYQQSRQEQLDECCLDDSWACGACSATSRYPARIRSHEQQKSRPAQNQAFWWTPMISMAACALLFFSVFPKGALAAVDQSVPGMGARSHEAVEAMVRRDEARYDENLTTSEQRALTELLIKHGTLVKPEELEPARLKVGFRRAVDGHVSLLSRDGRWFHIKLDMQSPGFLLLREEESGEIFFLPPDDTGRIMQIDLSDDLVVGQLFGSGAWQDVMQPLQAEEPEAAGGVTPLVLEAEEFRQVVSLMELAREEPRGEDQPGQA